MFQQERWVTCRLRARSIGDLTFTTRLNLTMAFARRPDEAYRLRLGGRLRGFHLIRRYYQGNATFPFPMAD